MKKRCLKKCDRFCVYADLVQIYVGLKNGHVQCFDVISRVFTGQFDATGGVGQLVGVKKHEKLASFEIK